LEVEEKMSKTLKKRLVALEQITEGSQFIVGTRDAGLYEGVEINGYRMTEQEFKKFEAALPKNLTLKSSSSM
jgi:hypothetical protein